MAFNPLHSNNPDNAQIYMLLVMRFSDKTILAYLSNGESDKEGVREQVASNATAKPGGRYSATGDAQSIHYTLDSASRVYAIVTHPKYSTRAAFTVLDELQASFQRDFGSRLATAPENGLSRVAKPLMKELIDKYQVTVATDKLSSVQNKIDVVKTVMQDNIQQLLVNNEQVERIATSAETLNEQSLAFKSSTKELRAKMYWKMWKMRLLIGGLIVVVLIVIIVPVALMSKSTSSGK